MEDSSPPPSVSPAAGASKFLANLPNRGLLWSTVASANPDGMGVYICDHDTSPPEDQLIKTNQMNILIRSLVLKKQKGESSSRMQRVAERAMDGRASTKRAVSITQNSSQQGNLIAYALQEFSEFDGRETPCTFEGKRSFAKREKGRTDCASEKRKWLNLSSGGKKKVAQIEY